TKPVTTFERSSELYEANRGSDGDKDGIACEKA
ncbi:MAG: excalibur calcium-binding domain-containing protein, partial [Actinomycetota bacterium]|nr:excalibur calcium-binding domain-containing protein [Actinomycetota bacterium]